MKTTYFFLLSIILFAACSPARNTAARGRIALTNVTIVDVRNGGLLPNQAVVIEGDRIIETGYASSVRIARGTSVIDAQGKYLVPGLWDMHVHLELATKQSLPYFIAYGVTGVRDMGANSLDTIKQWRNEIEQGKQVGPHIIAPGPIIDGPFFVNELRVTVNTPAEARKAVDSLVALGVDFIKVHQQISKDAYLALADQAAKHNIAFVGHKPASLPLQAVIEAGQSSIEHVLFTPGLNDTTISMMKDAGTFFTPTLLIIDKIARYNDSSLRNDKRLGQVSPILKHHWQKQTEAWGDNVSKTVEYMQSMMPVMQQRTASMQRAGVPLLAGTDMAIPYVYPGSSLHEELELLVRSGLSPLQALQAATINPARFFKKEAETGSIHKGKRADLVLLNANPLQDISNAKDINLVIFNGKVYDRKSLDAILE
ncbi:amidohydrolase family protein [Aridibaculum aurantiacum]|uniref:amidohydrolase family protein n=1 Tax=Aridibaculum aurantiacum TaxID=2810307 RepID=UPI001A97793B|nr:amidohydrolase family protein [Aridibaculum aurantiacum]